jgi:TPR repeat protein
MRLKSKQQVEEWCEVASHLEEAGQWKSAFRLWSAAARAGHSAAQHNIGYYYDVGLGVRPNRANALRWYRLAWRRNEASAAHNIGTIWRDDGNQSRALAWFLKAIRSGHEDSYIDVAKMYLKSGKPAKAIRCLTQALASSGFRRSKEDVYEAKQLLKEARAASHSK